MTMEVLRLKGETNAAIAKRLGITEDAVRYHLKRRTEKASDGRAKTSLLEQLQLIEVVDHPFLSQSKIQAVKTQSSKVTTSAGAGQFNRLKVIHST